MTTPSPRFGVAIRGGNPGRVLDVVRRADAAGVRMAWSTMAATAPDSLTVLAAALATTSQITVGTAIVPASTRHPLTMAAQAKALEHVGPGRFRLGIGTGNLELVERLFDQDVRHPLRRMRAYLEVLRPALPDAMRLHMAALGPAAFRLAGELTDGALAWLCPVDYLLDVAVPAVAAGAASAGRPAPPVVGHVPVAIDPDRRAVLARAAEQIGFFGTVPAYRAMFAAAGFSVGPDSRLMEDLLDDLVVSGTADEVAAQLRALVARGLPELMVTPVDGPDPRTGEPELLELLATLTERE